MPIFEYRCECGKHMDVLVRGGQEPATCDQAGEASNWCMKEGKLTRAVTAAHVGGSARDGSGPRAYNSETGAQVQGGGCGRCGQNPGSCDT